MHYRGLRTRWSTAASVGVLMSSFGIYLIGFIVLIVGLAVAASMIGVPPVWIGVGAIVLIGLGILTGVSRTRRPDPPGTT